MGQSTSLDLPLKIAGDELRKEGRYLEAAEKYAGAVEHAKYDLKDELISKSLAVEQHLCLCSISNELEKSRIKNLLEAIDAVIDLNLDDRNYSLLALKSFYTAVLLYLEENLDALQKHKLLIDEIKETNNSILIVLAFYVIEIGVLKYELNTDKLNIEAFDKKIKKLSERLTQLIHESNLPLTLATQLKNITAGLTSKKKINDFDKMLPKLCATILQSNLFDDILSNSFEYIKDKENSLTEIGEKLFVLNFVCFSLNIVLYSLFFFYFYSKYYLFLVAVLIPISLLWFKEERFKNIYLLKSKRLVAIQIFLFLMLTIVFIAKYHFQATTVIPVKH